jgi:hypothetical protein
MLAVDPEIADRAARPTSIAQTAIAKRDAAGIEDWIRRQLRVASVS